MTSNGYVVFGAAGVSAVLWLALGHRGAAPVCLGCVLLLVPGLCWRLCSVRRVAVEISCLPTKVPRGVTVTLGVSVLAATHRVWWQRPPSALEVTMTALGRRTSVRLGAGIGSDHVQFRRSSTALEIQMGLRAKRRGRYPTEVHTVEAVSRLGLWRHRFTVEGPRPPVVTVEPRWVPGRLPISDRGGLSGGWLTGDDVEGVRAYHPGDDVRLIDWAATARTVDGLPMVRQQTRVARRPLAVLLDQDRPPGLTAAAWQVLFEARVDLAFSLVVMGIRDRRPVVLITADRSSPHFDGSAAEALVEVAPCQIEHGASDPCRSVLQRRCRGLAGTGDWEIVEVSADLVTTANASSGSSR